MVTHFVFSLGVAVALGAGLPPEDRFALAVVLSLAVNLAIDELGHVIRHGFVSRSPLSHSVVSAPLWGGGIGYLAWWGWNQSRPLAEGYMWWFVGLGMAVAGSHLLLDSLTERGVFLLRGRIAVAHFRSRNLLLNGSFVLLGVALILGWPAG